MQQYTLPHPLRLERGGLLQNPVIAYHTYGSPDKPAVWVCHALTANSDVFDWWAGLFGPKDLFNPDEYFIVCANVLSSCYGSTGPLSENPDTGQPYYHDYPEITIRDMVAAHEALRAHLGIESIYFLLGGSLGGQQAMEWAVTHPKRVQHLALIATNARHSAWGIAFNEAQRMAIEADGTWKRRDAKAGDAGMRAARATALLSYRNYQTYFSHQTDAEPVLQHYKATTYQQYQGEKLSRRFNAFSYYRLSQAMDSHHIGRGRASMEAALTCISAKTLVIGITSAEHIPGALFECITSDYGHDGFLIETEKLGQLFHDFLDRSRSETPTEASSSTSSVRIVQQSHITTPSLI
jgi:homoserine O-acetyltransferase/O-succinyltransferase